MHGGLVKVNPMEGIITIDASDASLLGQTFQVYITCHVETNKLVQDSYYDFIPTFEVTVSSELYMPHNRAPMIDEFLERIELSPAS